MKKKLVFKGMLSAFLALSMLSGTACASFVGKESSSQESVSQESTSQESIPQEPIEKIEEYGIIVAGVMITSENASDILEDGKVVYDVKNNRLTFNNAVVESDTYIIRSNRDLTVYLEGENKFICRNSENVNGSIAIYVSEDMIRKDFSIVGTGIPSSARTSVFTHKVSGDQSFAIPYTGPLPNSFPS